MVSFTSMVHSQFVGYPSSYYSRTFNHIRERLRGIGENKRKDGNNCFSISALYIILAAVNPSNSYFNRIAHQETIKPYRYYLDGDKLYYQLSKDGKQSTDKIDHKVIKLSDHKQGTAVYGKQWVADKGATKAERQLVKQQEIVWYKATYKQGSASSENN